MERDQLARAMGPAVPGELRAVYLQSCRDEADSRAKRMALERDRPGIFARRRLSAELSVSEQRAAASRQAFETATEPHRRRLEAQIQSLTPRFAKLEARNAADRQWLRLHPEAARRALTLGREIGELDRLIENRRRALEGRNPLEAERERRLEAERRLELTREQPRRSPGTAPGYGPASVGTAESVCTRSGGVQT